MVKLLQFKVLFLPCFFYGNISKASIPSSTSVEVNGRNLQVSTIKIPKLDLFNGCNLANVTKKAIEFFLRPESASEYFEDMPFIFGTYHLPEEIRRNPNLESKLVEIVEYLNTFPEKTSATEDCLSKLYEMRSLLMEAHNLVACDTNITADNAFAKFIQGSIKAINVIVADSIAKKVFQEFRSQSETELLKKNTAASISMESSVGWGAFSLSISGSLDTKQGIGANSLYEISHSGNLSIGVGAKTPGDVLSLSLEAGATLTYTTLFHSIEQMFDTGQLKGIISEETSQKLSTRSALQNAERRLLSVMGNDVEGFLKMIGIVPFDTYVEWPHLTKAEAPMTSTALGGELAISAGVKSFTQLGMEISRSYTGTNYKKSRFFLSLLDNDSRPADNLTAKDIKRIIGKQYDFSRKLLKSSTRNVDVLVPMYILSGDLRGYVSIVQELAALEQSKDSKSQELAILKKPQDSKSIKELKQGIKKLKKGIKELTERKHGYESRLSPQHAFTSEGRLGVLKTYIVTAAMLSQHARTTEEITLCKKMFLELKKLESLLEFSKDESSRSGTFIQNANYSLIVNGISGTMKVDKCSITCDYSEYSNSPFLDENGKYLSFAITIPFSAVGSVAIQRIKDYISGKVFTEQEVNDRIVNGVKHIATDVLNWTEASKLLELETDLSVESPLKVGPSVSGSTKISAQSMWIEPNEHGHNSLKSLPGKELMVRNFPHLVIQCYKSSTSIKAGVGGKVEGLVPIPGVTVGGSVSVSHTTTGPIIIKLGTHTISYVLSKFNIWQMGVNEPKEKTSTAWEALKKNNRDAFSEILKNIAEDGSEPFYELQCLYNDILKNVDADTDLGKQCTKLFGKLLKNCKDFSAGKIDLQTALTSFDEVLKFNHEHNFLVHLNEAFSLHKASKH
jgi:hypothetical protein